MYWKWVMQCVLLLSPFLFLYTFYFNESMNAVGLPLGSPDVVFTHQFDYPQNEYPPFINLWNRIFPLPYGLWFLSLFSVLVFPFILLYRITGRLEVPAALIFGTLLATGNITQGLIPQALMINLGLLVWLNPYFYPAFIILSFFIHDFGGFFLSAVLMLRLFYEPVR